LNLKCSATRAEESSQPPLPAETADDDETAATIVVVARRSLFLVVRPLTEISGPDQCLPWEELGEEGRRLRKPSQAKEEESDGLTR